MTTEERNKKRREQYARKKEWQATLSRWVAFAEGQTRRAIEERGSLVATGEPVEREFEDASHKG